MDTFSGINGRWTHKTVSQYQKDDNLWFKQRFITERRSIKYYDEKCSIQASIRYDDECGNNKNSFSITGTILDSNGRAFAVGCIHDQISEAFPEIKHLIKYHLFDSTGPLHYIANTLYLAGDRDHWGLRKGETKPVKNGRTGKISKTKVYFVDGIETASHLIPQYIEDGKPVPNITIEYKTWCHVGEGKERQFDAARSSALWPDATDDELSADPAILKAKLEARWPALVESFRRDITDAGMLWIPTPEIIEFFKGSRKG